jgi:phosphohistidine swiveling domain-containing protein
MAAASKTALVLGAGGIAGGACLLGALSAIEAETGWRPADADYVVGTSAGSLIGALLASGVSPKLMVAYARGDDIDSPLLTERERRGSGARDFGSSLRLGWSFPRPVLDYRRARRGGRRSRVPPAVRDGDSSHLPGKGPALAEVIELTARRRRRWHPTRPCLPRSGRELPPARIRSRRSAEPLKKPLPASSAWLTRTFESAAERSRSGPIAGGGACREAGGRLAALPSPAVIVAHELSPADTPSVDRANLLAVTTEVGGVTSHAAIVARELGIPAVVGVEGAAGAVAGWRGATVDGSRREVSEARAAAVRRRVVGGGSAGGRGGAAEIGLFRMEFLFMSGATPPGEDEQAEVYEEACRVMAPNPAVIR